MDEESRNLTQVPLVALEMEQTRSCKNVKKLCTIIVLLIVVLTVTNAAWLYAWTRYDYTPVTQEGTVNTSESTQDWEGIDIVPED